jgi:broad-specificity NMP kinase
MNANDPPLPASDQPRIVVVGRCASGKTTLANNLRELGVNIRVCGQEHSSIRDLWKKMNPEILIVLDVDLETLRSRRHPSWPAELYKTQGTRLQGAIDAADAVIDTSISSEQSVVEQVLQIVDAHRVN